MLNCQSFHWYLSIHPFPAVNCTTVTRDFMLIVLQIKLVVVTQLKKRKIGEQNVKHQSNWVKSNVENECLSDWWDKLVLPLRLSGFCGWKWWWFCDLSQRLQPQQYSWVHRSGWYTWWIKGLLETNLNWVKQVRAETCYASYASLTLCDVAFWWVLESIS